MRNFILILFCFYIPFTAFSKVDSLPKYDSLLLESLYLKELRRINIWTPSDYENSMMELPVLYMLDGGIKEDFPHVAFTLEKLINEKAIAPMILVGIENTNRRRDLTGPTKNSKDRKIAPEVGGSENFRKFISDELFFLIKKHYKVNSSKSIIGESLAGLFIMETFFLKPELFDNYIAFDPSLWWNNGAYSKNISNYTSKNDYKNKRIWFAGSDTKDIQKYTRRLAAQFSNLNMEYFAWNYSDETAEKHWTIFKAAKEKSLKWIFNY